MESSAEDNKRKFGLISLAASFEHDILVAVSQNLNLGYWDFVNHAIALANENSKTLIYTQ